MLSMKEQITQAIETHRRWKVFIKRAIENKSSNVSLNKIAQSDQCNLGRWLASINKKDQDEHFAEVDKLHKEFHVIAGETVKLLLDGKTQEVEASMALNGDYYKASALLVLALIAWQQSSSTQN